MEDSNIVKIDPTSLVWEWCSWGRLSRIIIGGSHFHVMAVEVAEENSGIATTSDGDGILTNLHRLDDEDRHQTVEIEGVYYVIIIHPFAV